MQNIIYGLRDPTTDEYKYIGKTNVGISRAKSHLTYSHNLGVNIWINELREKSLSPIIDILENCEEETLLEKEKFWISFYKNSGCNLLNEINYFGSAIEKLEKEVIKKENDLKLRLNRVEFDKNNLKNIEFFIKLRRKMLKINQTDLSEISGVGLRTIKKMEKNASTCVLKNIMSCLNTLGLTLEIVIKK